MVNKFYLLYVTKILQQFTTIEKVSKHRTNKDNEMGEVIFMLIHCFPATNEGDSDKVNAM